jgi:uncharacterized protein
VRVRSDVERKRLQGLRATERMREEDRQSLYNAQVTQRTFDHLAQQAATLLDAGLNVVVDAAFLMRAERQRFRALAAAHGARFTVLVCTAEPAVLRQRIVQRLEADDDASDATLAVLARQQEFAQAVEADEAAVAIHTDRGDAELEATLRAAFPKD